LIITVIAIPLMLVFLYLAGFVSVDWRKSTTLHDISRWGKGELVDVICFLRSFLPFLLPAFWASAPSFPEPCSPAFLLPRVPGTLLIWYPPDLLLCFLLPYCPGSSPLLPWRPTALLLCCSAPLSFFSLFVFLLQLSCHCPLNARLSSDLFVCSIYLQNLGYALDPEGERFNNMKDLLRHFYKVNLPKCDVKLSSPFR